MSKGLFFEIFIDLSALWLWTFFIGRGVKNKASNGGFLEKIDL